MRVIITGGTGLIGRALVADLLRDGHEVIVLSRRPDAYRERMPAGACLERWDGHTAAGWGHLVEGADAVINLAGENIAAGRWTAERKQRIRESRVNAGRAVTEAITAASHKPRVLVQASAVGYYGPRGDEEVDEDTPPGDDFLGRVAVEWEASTAAVEEQGVRRVVIRTGIVLTPEGGALGRMLLPFRLGLGGPFGSGRQWFPWIHIADEVGAIRFLIENEATRGPYNLTAPNPVRQKEFARALGRALRRPAFLPVPAFALRLLFGEMADALLTGQRAIPRRLLEAGYTFRFPTLETALRNLLQSAR